MSSTTKHKLDSVLEILSLLASGVEIFSHHPDIQTIAKYSGFGLLLIKQIIAWAKAKGDHSAP